MKITSRTKIKKLDEIERQLKELPLLYISKRSNINRKISTEDTDAEVFIKILSESTYYNTYKGKSILQCHSGRNRSIGDLYRIMLSYRPFISFKDFRKIIIDLINKGNITTLFCHDINKRVYMLGDNIHNIMVVMDISNSNTRLSYLYSYLGREDEFETKYTIKKK